MTSETHTPRDWVGAANIDAAAADATHYANCYHDLLEALKRMVEEKADYMRLNNLGDPEEQHTVKQARAAIAKAEGRS